MILCIGLPEPAVGSAGCSSARYAPQYGAANVNVGGAGTASRPAARTASARWYTGLVSPTDLANLARTVRSRTTRHAPVCVPITLVSTAIFVRPHPREYADSALGSARSGRATVTPTS